MLKALILKPMYHSFQAPAPSVYRPDFNITDDALLNVGWMIIKMDDEIGDDDHFGLCCCLVTRVIYWCTFMDMKERLFHKSNLISLYIFLEVVLHFEAFITERNGLTKICTKVSGFDLLVHLSVQWVSQPSGDHLMRKTS